MALRLSYHHQWRYLQTQTAVENQSLRPGFGDGGLVEPPVDNDDAAAPASAKEEGEAPLPDNFDEGVADPLAPHTVREAE